MAEIASAPSTAVAATLTLTSGWLKDPLAPNLNLPVTVRVHEPVLNSRIEGVFYPLASPFPVVVQGTRHASRGAFTVLITTQADLDALTRLLEPARTLLFQMQRDSLTGPVTSLYVRITGDTNLSRIVQTTRPQRDLTLNYIEVARTPVT